MGRVGSAGLLGNGVRGLLMGHAPLVEKVQAPSCSQPIARFFWNWWLRGFNNGAGIWGKSGAFSGPVFDGAMALEVKTSTTKALGVLNGDSLRGWVVFLFGVAQSEGFAGATWQVARCNWSG